MNGTEPVVPAPVNVSGYEAPLTRPWPVALGLFLVVLNVALGLSAAFLAAWLGAGDLEGTARSLTLAVLLTLPYLLVIVAVWFAARKRGMALAESVGWRPMRFWASMGLAISVVAVGIIVSARWAGLLSSFGLEQPARLDATNLFPSDPLGVILLLLAAVVIGPIAEEIIFRGILYSSMRDRWGRPIATLLSASIFGAVHFEFVWVLVPTLVLGAMLAWLFEATRSLKAPIVAHMIYNLFAVGSGYLLKALG